MKLASVIIPYYKKRHHIKKTIKSVLNQSYKNFEIILVYDDENMNDLQFLKKNYKKNKKIKIFVNKKNIGAGLSRNRGIELSKGKYIAFLDADDEWHKSKLKKQIYYMKKKNISFTHTSYKIKNEKGFFISNRKAKDFFNQNDLLKSCDIGLSTVIMEKKIYNNNCKFPKNKTKEDFIFWLKLLKKGHKIYALKENLATWYKTEKSLSSSTIQKLHDGFNIYYKYMNFNFFKSVMFLMILSINYIKKQYLQK